MGSSVLLAPETLTEGTISIRERFLWQPPVSADSAEDRTGLSLLEIRSFRDGSASIQIYGRYSAELGLGSWLLARGNCGKHSEPLGASTVCPQPTETVGYLVRNGSLQLLVPVDPNLLALPWIENIFGADQPQPWSQLIQSLHHSEWFLEHLGEKGIAELYLVPERSSERSCAGRGPNLQLYRFSVERAMVFLLERVTQIKSVLEGMNEVERMLVAIDLVTHVLGERWAKRLKSRLSTSH